MLQCRCDTSFFLKSPLPGGIPIPPNMYGKKRPLRKLRSYSTAHQFSTGHSVTTGYFFIFYFSHAADSIQRRKVPFIAYTYLFTRSSVGTVFPLPSCTTSFYTYFLFPNWCTNAPSRRFLLYDNCLQLWLQIASCGSIAAFLLHINGWATRRSQIIILSTCADERVTIKGAAALWCLKCIPWHWWRKEKKIVMASHI